MALAARTLAASTAALALAAVLAPVSATAAVSLVRGPTPIPDGEATAPGDLTVRNDRLAFSLAVESQAPWGVPRGAIVDVAPVKDGEIGPDRVAFADFIPNNWSAWPSTYQTVEVIKETPEEVVVRGERDFGEARIETTYTLRDGSDRIGIVTTMTNQGSAPLTDLRSGLTLWPDSGYFFAVPGLADVEDGPAEGALSDRAVAYDEGWMIALHAPYFDNVNYGSMDLYQRHSLAPGESRRFEGWLQVGASGDLAPVVAAEIERKALPSNRLTGTVSTREGEPVAQPVVVVEKEGKPYAWTIGSDGGYAIDLPAGDYSVYASARGYSQGAPVPVTIAAGAPAAQDFSDLQAPGRLLFSVTGAGGGAPLDARIAIAEGQTPLVEFLGRRTFFTALDDRGKADVSIAPGDYVLTVSHGQGFLGAGEDVPVTVEPNATKNLDVALDLPFDPGASGWYASDMHHHADQLEGVTPPADVARAELAAGLDVLFLSDHDATVNNAALQEIADRRGVAFIPSIEFSPSWGHFNAFPLDLGETVQIDPSTATAPELLAEARRLGADAIQVNHPFIPYGYFASLDGGVAPGGFDPGFDLLEINSASSEDDQKVMERIWSLWNQGHRYYLSAGSDVHDVWNDPTGLARVYVRVDGALTAESFVRNLKEGRAYVTYGPLIRPDYTFGDEVKVRPGDEVSLGFDLQAVNGLKQIELVSGGEVVETETFGDEPREARAEWPVTIEDDAWYSVVVEDAAGNRAYSNPVWFDAVTYETTASAE